MATKWKNYSRRLTKEKKVISLGELAKKLKNEESVAIFCHVRPDGDCIGSALALSLALKHLGRKADVFCDDQIPSRFLFLNSIKEIKNEITEEYSAYCAIDSGDLTRLGDFASVFLSHKNTFNIDHHVSNPRYANVNYVFDNASNSENIYALIMEMNVEVSEEMANLLAMGIMTDTGNFRHKNVTPNTFFIASKLVEKGADVNEIYYHMFSAQSKARAKLFGKTMSKIRYLLDDRFAVISVTQKDLEETNALADETEGFIDFIMGIHGVEVGASVLEIDKNKFKISFRSKKANVSEVAGAFGGGGHILASGCQIHGEYEEVIDKIRFEVSKQLID